jgi:hypothetical protein
VGVLLLVIAMLDQPRQFRSFHFTSVACSSPQPEPGQACEHTQVEQSLDCFVIATR